MVQGCCSCGPSGPETHELTVAAGDSASVLLTLPLLATTRLHLRLAVPQPGQEAMVERVAAPGNKLLTPVTLTPAISEMEVTAEALGAVGQYVQAQNNGTGAVHGETTVLA